MPRDWDARTYDRVADPMTRWGATVLDRLPLRGDERVLDAGCGSGRVTEQLAERRARAVGVIALDGSPSMVEAARERLARFGDRIEYVVADLGLPLPIDGTGRRGALDRDLPLGARPRRPVRQPRRGHSARRLARRAVRRGRQHRLDPAGARDDRRRLAGSRRTSRPSSRPRAGSTRPATSTSNAG